MALLVKRAGANEYGTRMKLLLCGEPGAGKTRMSSTFPDVFIADAEGGLMSVADRQTAHISVESTEQLNELRRALSQPPAVRERQLGCPVQTICIDTLDWVQRLLVAERLADQKKDAMAIADWGWLGDQLRAFVRAYRNLDMHVVFTCHVRSVEDSESGATYVKPALQGAMQDEIAQYVDVAGLLRAYPTSKIVSGASQRVLTRVLQTSPDLRHPWLKDRSGKLPMELEVNLTNDFATIFSAIFPTREVVPPSVSVAPAPAPAPGTAKAAREAAKRPAQPPAEPPAEVAVAPSAATEAAAPDLPKLSRPVSERAGTVLDHRFTTEVLVDRDGKKVKCGLIDSSKSLYQLGGEINNLVLWKDKLVGFGIEEWDAIKGLEWIEVIDSTKNECWHTDMATAIKLGRTYDAGAGPRYGVPVAAFAVIDASGAIVRERALGEVLFPHPETAPLEATASPDQLPLNGNGSEPGPEPGPEVAESVVAAADEVVVVAAEVPVCEVCGEAIESSDQLELGLIRFRKQLCRTHFVAMKTAKR